MITAKFISSYQKEYEKEVATGEPSVYRDADEYFADCLQVYEKYCMNNPTREQIETWLGLLRNPNLLGYKMAFLSRDMELLHNALYQSAVIGHAQQVWSGGYDHCLNVWEALDCAAAGLTERIPLLLPEKLGMSSNGHPVMVTITNLLMTLWYKRADFEAESRKKAERTLCTKQAAIDYAVLRYLVALLDGDVAEAGEQLDLYCRSVTRVQEFGVTKLMKMFWPRAHGLYNIAFVVWEGKKALEIPLPEPDCFCTDLAEWQTAWDFRPGKLFLEYPAPFDLVGRILDCPPPEYTLHQPYLDTDKRYRKQYYMDVDRFKKQLIAKVCMES